MKLRRVATAAALGVGAAAAVNEALRHRAGPLPPALDGVQSTYRWRGMDVAYTERGDPADPDVVLLHGINAAGTSGEWRAVFEGLAEEYHVVAPDLPGFGRSDRPPLRYSAALYEDFVGEFLAEFEEPRVVASSLSAAYVAGAARRKDLDARRYVVVCPSARAGPVPPKGWARELYRAPVVGEAAFNLLTAKPAIRYFNADHGYWDADAPDESWVDYEWQTSHQENARYAPASFVSGHLNSDIDLGTALGELSAPVTIVWGREAELTPLSDGRDLADEADAELVVFDHAKLLPHVEWADQFVDVVAAGAPEPPDE